MMKKILLIEDNVDVRENTAEILALVGYKVDTAENGKVGVMKAKSDIPDLIICDIMMPELDGFGVRKILNNDPDLLNVPFIFLTAKTEKSDFRKGMGLGADDYITKPFDDVQLLEAVEIRLKKKIEHSASAQTNTAHHFYNPSKADHSIHELLTNRETRIFKRKDVIYKEDNYPKWVYWIQSGMIKSCRRNAQGKEIVTSIHGKNEFLDLTPILLDTKYVSYAKTMQDTEVVLIPIEAFKSRMTSDSDFATKMICQVAQSAQEKEDKLVDIAFNSVRKKLSNTLLVLAEKVNAETITILREDLAAMTGSAKETIIRTISDFKSEGLIDLKGHDIILKDIARLKNLRQ